MAKKTQTVLRVSDLPVMNKLWKGMKTIAAVNRQNYLIDISNIEGRRIIDMSEFKSDESGGKNVIYINFNDNETSKLYVYNGSDGEKGKTGGDGEDGDQGEEGYINPNGRGITGTMYIVNNSVTEDPNLPWSAYRGKDMNDKVYELNETFVSEEEFNLLFNEIKYIYAEFKTEEDNKSVRIFNSDNNKHVVYKKYWTYEDDGGKTYYIFNPISNQYDAVNVDLWKDIYLGDKEGYFPITTPMITDGTTTYYYDKETFTYKEVEKISVERTAEDNSIITVYRGDKKISNYYIPELDVYVTATYSVNDGKWSFVVNATSDYIPDVYKVEFRTVTETQTVTDDEGTHEVEVTKTVEEYVKLSKAEVLAIDTTVYAQYYKKNGNSYELITNIASYLKPGNVRYYKRNVVEDNGEYSILNNNKYCEVPVSEIDFDSLTEDFLVVSFDKLSNKYTFERHYPGKLYGEDIQFIDTVELSSVDLYYHTDSQVYYTSVLTLQPDGTYSSEYVEVEIPNWIYAEFKTNDEDQVALILNSNEDTTGKTENNDEEDNTAESLDDTVVTDTIFRIVPGIKDPLYIKTADGRYSELNLGRDEIYQTSEYYSWDGKSYIYTEISGIEAKTKSRLSIYDKVNNIYSIHTGDIIDENYYWFRSEKYIRVENPEEYISTYDLTLFTDEPKILPISIYPATNLNYVTVEYDPTKIIFFENGRIAATIGKDYTTLITIKSENSEVEAYINVHVTTPVSDIVFNQSNITSIDIEDEVEFKYSISPADASNKNIIWNYNSEIISVEQVNDTTVKIKGIGVGNTDIDAIAADGFGGSQSIPFEVVRPAASVNWDENDSLIKYVEPVYYTPAEIIAYNANHEDQLEEGAIKVPGYYTMVALLYKEYVLSPVVLPEDTTYPEITWTSSNPNVANVASRTVKVIDVPGERREVTAADIDNNAKDASGNELTVEQIGTIVTFVNEKSHEEIEYYLTSSAIGTVNITGSLTRYPDLQVSVQIRIDQSITQINVYPDSISLNVNTRKKLSAEVLPNTAVNGTISWNTSDERIVSVSPTGTITANNVGNASIIVRAEDGSGVEGICNVNVTIPSKDIILNGETENGIVYLGIGKTTTITADVMHDTAYGSNESNMIKEVNWESTDKSVATIDSNGVVTGISLGKTTIIANAQDGSGVFGTIQLRVIKLAETLSFAVEEVEMEVNDSLVLIPVFTPEDTTNEIVRWESSDETIAKVKESGIVYALAPGTATITAKSTDGTDLTATCTVTIL